MPADLNTPDPASRLPFNSGLGPWMVVRRGGGVDTGVVVSGRDDWIISIDVEDLSAPPVAADALERFEGLLQSCFGAVGCDAAHGRYHARFGLRADR
jgi:hypothetical protein